MIVSEDHSFLKQCLRILSSFNYFLNTQEGLKKAEDLIDKIKNVKKFEEDKDVRSARIITRIKHLLSLRDITRVTNKISPTPPITISYS
ncbi:hypothetical protein HZS_7718 [Henneguya salminicola]|nr:hypothetical protein HZS_7718 [Henneguya salminicola]